MTLRPNPFPDYPVATIDRAGEELEALTVRTQGIVKAESLVDQYLERMVERSRGVNVAVQGEFGTGKTHLLRYAAHRLQSRSNRPRFSPGVLRVATIEATPAQWYTAAIGPQLANLDLERAVRELLALAAQEVARRAPLTSAVVPELESNPDSVLTLVQHELLNRTTVELELIEMLERSIPSGISTNVRSAICALAWGQVAALRWLEGEALSEREMLDTGLPESLATDELASDSLVAIASVYAALDRPFLFLIDELEHLIRFDDSANGHGNVTWLKRLLEHLEAHGAMVWIAGRKSAWSDHPDFLDRFSPGATIELQALHGEEVMAIAKIHAGSPGTFSQESAELVASLCGGNIRRVLTLLHEIHRQSEGFEAPITKALVEDVAAANLQRTGGEQAQDQLAKSFSDLGLRVARQANVKGVAFDLIAYEGDIPVAVVEIKHALFGKKQQEQAQRFIDKVRTVNRISPSCTGVFLSEGPLDTGLLQLDSSAAKILWLDLTAPDFAERARESLQPLLSRESSDRVNPHQREAALSGLEVDIQSLKDAQAAMYEQLEERLAAVPSELSGLEFQAAPASATQDARRTVFEDLTHRPSFYRQLGLIAGPRVLAISLLMVIGIGALLLASTVAENAAGSGEEYTFIRVLMFLGGALTIVLSAAIILRQLLFLDRFFTFKRERLRDVYVRDLPIEALVDTNFVIENALSRWGPRHAPAEAVEQLMEVGLLPSLGQGRHE